MEIKDIKKSQRLTIAKVDQRAEGLRLFLFLDRQMTPLFLAPWPHCPSPAQSSTSACHVKQCTRGPTPSTLLEESPVYLPREEVAASLCTAWFCSLITAAWGVTKSRIDCVPAGGWLMLKGKLFSKAIPQFFTQTSVTYVSLILQTCLTTRLDCVLRPESL